MSSTRTVSIVALFTSLTIATNYGLAALPNVKLEDTLVFCSAYSFGLRIGMYVAIASELVWGMISPYGFGGIIIPFLVVGELLYALAGSFASKLWPKVTGGFRGENLFFGAIIAICAFVWDTETNIGTGLIMMWPHATFLGLIGFEIAGAIFMVFHELGDFLIGSALAPVVILYFSRVFHDAGRMGHVKV